MWSHAPVHDSVDDSINSGSSTTATHLKLLAYKQILHAGQAFISIAGDSFGQQSLLSMLTAPLQVSFCAECRQQLQQGVAHRSVM